jgi:Enoyl-(Acyl carrier protein) reductase
MAGEKFAPGIIALVKKDGPALRVADGLAFPNGIRVNCIAPETILTERNKERIPDPQQRELAEYHPLRRLGTPEDVARTALFLAAEESSWITGVRIRCRWWRHDVRGSQDRAKAAPMAFGRREVDRKEDGECISSWARLAPWA